MTIMNIKNNNNDANKLFDKILREEEEEEFTTIQLELPHNMSIVEYENALKNLFFAMIDAAEKLGITESAAAAHLRRDVEKMTIEREFDK